MFDAIYQAFAGLLSALLFSHQRRPRA